MNVYTRMAITVGLGVISMTSSFRHAFNIGRSTIVVVALLIGGCADPVDDVSRISLDTKATDEQGQDLGMLRFPNSCTEDSQEHLNRGLALLHHMTYIKSKEAFLQAAKTDPDCAIAYWGAAMTHIHPLWPDAVQPEALISGRKLLEKSEDAKNTSDRERAYLSTLQAFYDEDNASERNRLQKFLSGWTSIHEQYPEDLEARLFYALALLAVPPADNLDFAVQQKAGAIAEAVKAEIPKHPGANHYIIHAYDFPPLARRALETARHYDEVAPENSHALHMPSHIFTRRGLWPESITYNVRAAEAAIARTPDGRVSMHHMHAIDYLVYAYLQQAEDEKALEVLERMNTLESPHQNHAATAYAFAAIPARLSLEMHRWDEAARLIPRTPASFPWDQYPHLVAIPVFAKALGAARTGDFTTAEDAIEELAILKEQAAALNMIYDWGVQVEIQKVAAEAWLAFGRGDIETALALMQMSADMESSTGKNPVTPGEVLPARELYGDMLLEIGRFQQARSAYEAVLKRTPNRFLSIFGAGHSAELSGDDRAAREYYMKLLDNSPNPTSDRVELTIARDSLASNA